MVSAIVMASPLVECVPNFSEGRDESIIDEITASIRSTEGVKLLDVDMSADFNRTVVTMVGSPNSVLRAAIESTGVALNLIDMSNHSGEHARMGAVDVVPFIPITDISMDECVNLSHEYGKSVSEMWGIPVYLYAESAVQENRVKLPNIRKGEYEGLSEKILLPEWKPDFGPAKFVSKSGATATGARSILIAFNVNLDSDDKTIANAIASKIRTSGSIVKDDDGNNITDEHGNTIRNPGIFQCLQAAGWMYDENTAQVSMNLLDYSVTGLHMVTEQISMEAQGHDLNAVAGELVGLVPLDAILDAGRFYLNNDAPAPTDELIKSAVMGLKLDVLDEFIPQNNIIEYAMLKD